MSFTPLLRVRTTQEALQQKFPVHTIAQPPVSSTITLTTTLHGTTAFFTSRDSATWTLFVRPQPLHAQERIVDAVKNALQPSHRAATESDVPTHWDYASDPAFASTSMDSHVPPPRL
jgi:hypothetical protein